MDQDLKSTILEAFNYAISAVKGQKKRASVPAVVRALDDEVMRFENARLVFSKTELSKK